MATPPPVTLVLAEVTLQRFKSSSSSGLWEARYLRGITAEQGCAPQSSTVYMESPTEQAGSHRSSTVREYLSGAQAQLLVPSSLSP